MEITVELLSYPNFQSTSANAIILHASTSNYPLVPDTTSISSSSNQSRVTTTPGPSSVSSSGYPASPSVITLDSPSPPRSPRTTTSAAAPPNSAGTQLPSCMMASTNGGTPAPDPIFGASMPCLDLDNEASSANLFSY